MGYRCCSRSNCCWYYSQKIKKLDPNRYFIHCFNYSRFSLLFLVSKNGSKTLISNIINVCVRSSCLNLRWIWTWRSLHCWSRIYFKISTKFNCRFIIWILWNCYFFQTFSIISIQRLGIWPQFICCLRYYYHRSLRFRLVIHGWRNWC